MWKRYAGARQTTVASEIFLTGTGVHSGLVVSMVIHPSDADSGIRFVVADGSDIIADIPADFRAITNVTLCTVLGDADGNTVATVEHLLAALRGLAVDNCLIEVDAGEVPIMDGSAASFVEAIDEVGVKELNAPRRFIKVLKPVRVHDGASWGEIAPHAGFSVDVEIDFDTPLIGCQRLNVEVSPATFRTEVSRARTFGFMKDVERLWAAGRALGASLDNTIAIGDDRVINPTGLRYKNEFVRHKTLDAIGDLALAGAPLLGAFRSKRGGHRLNAMVLNALFSDRSAWGIVSAPRTRDVVHTEIGYAAPAMAFAADRT